MSKTMIVVGKVSVKAILENRKRPIHQVYILDSKKDKETRYILSQVKDAPLKRVSREFLDELTQTNSHGGFAIEVSKRNSDSIEAISQNAKSIMCIEGVSDPFNLGEILRTISSLGFDALITPAYDFYEHEAKLIRASAGGSEKILWLQSDDLVLDLKILKTSGFSITSAHRQENSHSLPEYTFDEKVCINLGGALRGLSKSVLELSDDFVRLDYENRMALSTQGAASVFAYARYLQTRK